MTVHQIRSGKVIPIGRPMLEWWRYLRRDDYNGRVTHHRENVRWALANDYRLWRLAAADKPDFEAIRRRLERFGIPIDAAGDVIAEIRKGARQ
ncbi:hypothetical protein [Sinorhizobium fredii]|uniref:hypothetical protein n=1 Tax=Rhizobium fredii TaxID=380 RepID=UPI003515FBFA